MKMSEGEQQDIGAPLLESLYPDCPGCKCAHLTAKGSGPPFKVLSMVSLIVICCILPTSSLFPFMYFMVDDFKIAPKKEDIGYYAGALGSMFMFGRFCTSIAWGVFADKYGRRPAFVLGLLSVVILQMIFGTTKNFWVAITVRFLLGAFNGMFGTLKAYASEVCNEESQAWGLSTVSTSWNLGLMIGPAMGGFLARPAVNFPSLFSQDGFFGQYPYILPSIVQAVFALAGLFVIPFMPETLHKHQTKQSSADQTKLVESAEPKESLWRNYALMATIAVYCIWCFMELAFTEVFSLWSVSPLGANGLGLPTSDVGMIIAIAGTSVFAFNMTLFPMVASYLGPIMVTRIPAMISVPLMILFPLAVRFHGTVQWLFLNVLASTRSVLSTAVITGTFMLTNNAVPTHQRGVANGIAMTFVSLFRSGGPATAGAIFAWSQSRENARVFPGIQLVFAVLECCILLAVLATYPPFLPKSTNRPYNITHPEEKPVRNKEEEC
ncbi:hypothetical protein R1flu_013035 [Riccia fluitans]|uniref:Major facilitator superfamily (MFS) profile domain-containing protein n=1 Tax=Riccia fluitans TaxID=41844 RepID=A0ABD1ZCA9_9MARC